MKLDRKNESGNVTAPVMVTALIRKDGTITSAGEWHYTFVGKNSGLPFYDFMPASDGNILAAAIQKYLSDPGYAAMEQGKLLLELVTELDNRNGHICSGIYLSFAVTHETENGEPLGKICYSALSGFSGAMENDRMKIAKYRYFMSMRSDIYFEYNTVTNGLVLYKYFNGNCFVLADSDLDEYIESVQEKYVGDNPAYREEMDALIRAFKDRERNISHTVQYSTSEGYKRTSRFMGGSLPGYETIVAGIYISNNRASDEPYYMTPAARDAGTGLLNKKAVTEYIIDMLPTLHNRTAWIVMIDIDDFKNIIDNF